MASKPYIDAPYSKMKAEIVKILKQEGYVKGCTQTDDRTLRIHLKYTEEGKSVITEN